MQFNLFGNTDSTSNDISYRPIFSYMQKMAITVEISMIDIADKYTDLFKYFVDVLYLN
jgi:hypothetical protein